MQTFKNTNFSRRDPNCTNVIACQAEATPRPQWEVCDEDILIGLDHLYTRAGVRYYGYL